MKKIKLTGVVGYDLITSDIQNNLNEANGDDLEVYIASPGGSVFEGLEIYNLFRDYKRNNPKAQIIATIKGLAASMATYLAVNPAFDLVCAEDNAVFMIHNALTCACGDYKDMQKVAEVLEGLTNLIADKYVKKTGKSKEEILQMMDEETWLFGDEIKKAGFIDEMIKTDNKCGKEKNAFVSEAKLQFETMRNKLQSENKKENLSKIAACLNIKNEASTPAKDAGENKITGGVVMTLEELKAQHPALYSQVYNEGKEAGKKEEQNSIKEKIDKAKNFVNSKDYPEAVVNTAIEVITGSKPIEILDVMAASSDMFKELKKSQAAVEEQPEDTPAEGQSTGEEDGLIDSPEAFMNQIKKDKGGN